VNCAKTSTAKAPAQSKPLRALQRWLTGKGTMAKETSPLQRRARDSKGETCGCPAPKEPRCVTKFVKN
jgi:hypothetical protein